MGWDTQRRAVTRRASRILASEPAPRKQDEARFGQTWLEQFKAADRILSRSPLASTAASRTSTLGAKPGKAITDAPRNENIRRAERDLTIWGLLTIRLNPSAFGDRSTTTRTRDGSK